MLCVTGWWLVVWFGVFDLFNVNYVCFCLRLVLWVFSLLIDFLV